MSSLIETAQAEFIASATTVNQVAIQVLSSSIRVRGRVSLKAAAGNAGTIYVGQTNHVSSANGYPLAANEGVDIYVNDVSKIWVIASADSQVLKWTCS